MKKTALNPTQQIADLRTTKQLAKECRKPISTIQRWTRQGIIPCVELGWRTKFYDRQAVRDALMRKMK
jgi:DNA-binding transcriptional MerR regulator